MFPERELHSLDRRQARLVETFRDAPIQGKAVECLGRKFVIFPNVFWAFYDNPLLAHLPVSAGESVLDVGTGCGVIAVFAAEKGARSVVALDINPAAVACARRNAALNGFSKVIDVRESDMFGALAPGESFDVITGNLPFRDKSARDVVELSMWDDGLQAHRKFFAGASRHLNPGGRIYLNQANFGAVAEMKRLAKESGFAVRRIAVKKYPRGHPLFPCEFYAFELARKRKRV